MIMWAKDASRAIDYAETRPDLDHEKLAYYGYSWGSGLGAIILAVEPRIRVGGVALGGLDFVRPFPEVDTVNFLPRVKQPVLMLNGRYDFNVSGRIVAGSLLSFAWIARRPEKTSPL